jgi:apoptosis-inducing factor 2
MLLNKAYPDRFRKDVEARIRTRGVNVVLGDHIDELYAEGAGEVRTRKGVTIKTDLAVSRFFISKHLSGILSGTNETYQLLTRGPRPNTSFISSSLGVDVLAKNGYVKILPTLQLPSNARIFAAGDIIDFPEQKQVGKYYTHANIVTANILSVLADQPATIEYRGPSFEGIVITIGKVRSHIDDFRV